ncbi:MAG: hypothetical protein ACLQKY_11635 [Terracidiphilus sp.]
MKELHEWYRDCSIINASDVPAAGKPPASPKKSGLPVKAAANEAARQEEKPAGEVSSRHGGEDTGPDDLGGQ